MAWGWALPSSGAGGLSQGGRGRRGRSFPRLWSGIVPTSPPWGGRWKIREPRSTMAMSWVCCGRAPSALPRRASGCRQRTLGMVPEVQQRLVRSRRAAADHASDRARGDPGCVVGLSGSRVRQEPAQEVGSRRALRRSGGTARRAHDTRSFWDAFLPDRKTSAATSAQDESGGQKHDQDESQGQVANGSQVREGLDALR